MFRFKSKHVLNRNNFPTDLEARADIRATRSVLRRKAKQPLQNLLQAIEHPTDDLPQQIAQTFSYTSTLGEAISQLNRLLAIGDPTNTDPTNRREFVISSVLLQQAVRYLIADEQKRERMLLVTGIEKAGSVFLTQTLPVQMSQQSSAYVQADPRSIAKLLLDLDKEEHLLWAMWHSHPTAGKHGTHPSQTDLSHQQRMVDFGLPHMLGGITSSDGGWFRLFSTAQDFDVNIVGGDSIALIENNPREKVIKLQHKESLHALPSPK